jgi:hypothetical protein
VSFEVCAVYWSAICNGNAGHMIHVVGRRHTKMYIGRYVLQRILVEHNVLNNTTSLLLKKGKMFSILVLT